MEVSWHCTSELRKLQSVPKEGGLSPCPQSTFFLPSHQTLPLPVSAPLRPATLSPRLMGPDTDRDPQECHTLGGCSNFSTPIIQMWKLRLGRDHDSRHSSWGLSQLPLYRCTNRGSGDTMTPDIPPGDFSTPIIQMQKLRLGGDHDSRYSSWGQRCWLWFLVQGAFHRQTSLTPSAAPCPHPFPGSQTLAPQPGGRHGCRLKAGKMER